MKLGGVLRLPGSGPRSSWNSWRRDGSAGASTTLRQWMCWGAAGRLPIHRGWAWLAGSVVVAEITTVPCRAWAG